jgi:general nucleoside transport system ATP-binding protein
MSLPIIEMRGISKHFGSLLANDNVSLSVVPGEILGLLGENGAGKTTLMNVLFGVYASDSGSILIDGKQAQIHNSADALKLGIGMVHQHFHLAPRLSVIENLLVGTPGKNGQLDIAGAHSRLAEIEREFGLKLDPDRLVSSLAVGEQQRLEIMKALFRGARLLILDEPTAVLAPADVDGLFIALRAIAAKGLGIIFISHKLNEVRALTTRCIVLRQGKLSGEFRQPAAATAREIAELMCGHEITTPTRPLAEFGKPVLELQGVSTTNQTGTALRNVSLSVRAGEIVGIAGVSGNGQRALADLVSGLLRPNSGTLKIAGRSVDEFSPRTVQSLGLGRIPEDRLASGLVSNMSLAHSIVLPRISQAPFSRNGLLQQTAIAEFAREQINEYDIKCQGPDARTGTLSGGNLQKALLARELAFNPKVLIVSQPTRGLDIGAAHFVYDKFLALRASGCGLLVISEDLEELLTLSDRIAVLYEGEIVGLVESTDATVSKLGLLMAGGRELAA